MTRSGEVGRGEEGKSRGTERGASLGMPFRVSRQVAISSKRRPSEPAGVKRNHTDLHIMIYILVLCLSSTLSPLVSTASDRRPLFSRCVPQHPAASPRSFSSSLSSSLLSRSNTLSPRVYTRSSLTFSISLEKCHFTDVSDSQSLFFSLFPSLSLS